MNVSYKLCGGKKRNMEVKICRKKQKSRQSESGGTCFNYNKTLERVVIIGQLGSCGIVLSPLRQAKRKD